VGNPSCFGIFGFEFRIRSVLPFVRDGCTQVEDETQPHSAGSRRASKRSGPPALGRGEEVLSVTSHLVSENAIVSLKAVLGEVESQSPVSAKGDALAVGFWSCVLSALGGTFHGACQSRRG
jgi:hypothetical protein